jgi:hypothetical protein
MLQLLPEFPQQPFHVQHTEPERVTTISLTALVDMTGARTADSLMIGAIPKEDPKLEERQRLAPVQHRIARSFAST